MPTDDILDHFDWEKNQPIQEDSEWGEEFDYSLDPDAEIVRIKRYPFNWQAELAVIVLRKYRIPYYLANSLTSNMFQFEWAQVDLYVHKENAEEALALLRGEGTEAEEE